MFPAKPLTRALENERVRIDGGPWERCAFVLHGDEFEIVRGDDASPTQLPLTSLREIRVHRGPDGAVTEVELEARDGRILAAQPRPTLIDTMLARGWEAGVTITATTADAEPPATPPRRRANF